MASFSSGVEASVENSLFDWSLGVEFEVSELEGWAEELEEFFLDKIVSNGVCWFIGRCLLTGHCSVSAGTLRNMVMDSDVVRLLDPTRCNALCIFVFEIAQVNPR